MNTLYCCCIHEPWLSVATGLEKKGYKAAYWIGWPEGENKVKESLPNSTYHDINSAWKGLFTLEFEAEMPFSSQLDGIELKEYAYEELMAIRMMERLDRDRKSFSFIERQYFFRRQLNDWLYILKEKEIELIIFPSIPHRVFDYVIYVAAKILGIKFLSFLKTRWAGELIPINSTLEKVPDLTLPNTTQDFGKVNQYIEKIQSNYDEAEPQYMIEQSKDAEKAFTKKLLEKSIAQPKKLQKLFNEFPIYWKEKGATLEESKHTRLQVYVSEYRGNIYKKRLKKYYESICEPPNFDLKYLLVALHYQPEVNSVPLGNIYGDQLMMIRALLKHTPPDVHLFVKEHKSQFMPKLEGQTGRTKEFYDQLLNHDRVHFISTEIDPFSLIDKAMGVCSLTGTICLQAIIRNKPSVIFGNVWYEHIYGVLKADSLEKMERIEPFLSNFQPKKGLVKQQINNILSQSLRANHYKRVAQNSDVSNEESIINLIKYITSAFPNE